MKKESQLRSALSDIINGFCFYEKEGFYLKHLTLEDYVDYELKYDNFYENLRKKRVLNNEELIEQAIKRDLWSQNDEYRIKDLKNIIQTVQENSQKLILEAQKKAQEDYLEELKEELNLLNREINRAEELSPPTANPPIIQPYSEATDPLFSDDRPNPYRYLQLGHYG